MRENRMRTIERCFMEQKSNNLLIIITVISLVVAIAAGAGLCYLSWDMKNCDKDVVSTETVATTETTTTETVVTTETAAKEEKEEGLQANTVTMDQIEKQADGTYQYVKDGQVASKKGIDVSKYQKNINWSAVAADGVEYAFVRVGCRGYGAKGTLILDEKFGENALGATEHGIKLGAYFFSQAITVEEALEEARLVVKAIKDYDVTYPVAIDIERVQGQKARQDKLTKEARTEIAIAFCEYIKEAGYTPMVYGDLETFTSLLDAEQLSEYDFWISEVDGKMTFPYEFAVWQYSHKGKVAGIKPETSYSISLKEW